jgi:hypothetical protein
MATQRTRHFRAAAAGTSGAQVGFVVVESERRVVNHPVNYLVYFLIKKQWRRASR